MTNKKEIINEFYDAALLTTGVVGISFLSKKLMGRGLGPITEVSGALKHLVALGVASMGVNYLKENKYIPGKIGVNE